MKRYFSMSLTLFAFSVLNATTYLLLGLTTGNTNFATIFSITYPLQFVVSIILSFFASASNIRANKENNKNCVDTGIILGIIVGLIIFSMVAIFVDNYISFMNMDPTIYRYFTLMAIGQLFFGLVIYIVTEKLYFQNRDKLANISNLGFIILNLVTVVITSLITKNQVTILLVNLISLFVYDTIWFAFIIKKFKFDFNIIKNFKYESLYIISSILMLTIYLFGYSHAFSYGIEYTIALNFVNLITDPQWDALSAIAKIAKIEISQSCYNYKSAIKKSAVISCFYVATSIILFFALFNVYNVVLTIGLIFLAIQTIDMLLGIYKANLQTFLQLEYSPTKSTIIYTTCKVIRTVLSLVILSPYNTNIAQIISGFLILSSFVVLRFKYYRMNSDGFLIKKEKVTTKK